MNGKNEEKLQEKLIDTLQRVATSLEEIALQRAIDMFYPVQDRTSLLTEYRALLDADIAAYDELQRVRDEDPDGSIGWEARVEKYGEEEARRRHAPFMSAFNAKRAASERELEFKRKHPLIAQLHRFYPSVVE
ncbi:hypothetical protein MYA_6027 (plasmid) [Burkholderia sp. KJ006]|uniref:hypothetical protein n=1 Tax=Burkholderia sp. KJ006 TaxID=416344 RepID=UPI00025F0E30|nr:hypothetical protein [Burkholderia sp. KJ006]AFJ90361.1 hypothetical protein MYA_6027 [Burkholderia sp. KJ006]